MHDDWSEIDFARVTSCAASSQVRAVTVQMSALGDEGNTNEGERGENVEVLQPLGLMAVPSITQTTEAPFLRIGDRQVALGIIDKGATPQACETGEVRLYGPGSQNATAVVRIRADGSIEITSKAGRNIAVVASAAGVVVLQNGSQAFVRGNDFSTALNTGIDAIKVLNVAVGTFATAVGVGTPLFPAVAAAAVVLNTAVGVCNTALDVLKASSSTWLSTKVLGQ
jgi:hypothetical protein